MLLRGEKMKRDIKIISSILTILLILHIIFPLVTNIEISVSYAAAIAITDSGVTYSYSNNTNAILTITGSGIITDKWKSNEKLSTYVAKVKSVKINSDNITAIGDNAFSNCVALTTVTYTKHNITSIGTSAFNGCTALASITIPTTVTTIGVSAFNGCTALTSITIPMAVTTIKRSAFEGCTSLTTVKYGEVSTKYYGNKMKIYRSIESNLTTIEENAFKNCTKLQSFTLNNEKIETCDCDAHLLENISSIGDNVFLNTAIKEICILNKTAGGRVSSNQTIRCYRDSAMVSKAFESNANITYIIWDTELKEANIDQNISYSYDCYASNHIPQPTIAEANTYKYTVNLDAPGYLILSTIAARSGCNNANATVYIWIDRAENVKIDKSTAEDTATIKIKNQNYVKQNTNTLLSPGTHTIEIYVGVTNRTSNHNPNHMIHVGVSYIGIYQQGFAVDYNGNTATSGNTPYQSKIKGETLTLKQNGFTKTGYTFTGWNTRANGTGSSYSAGANYATDASMLLYAQWRTNRSTLKVHPNGGSWNNTTNESSFTENYNTTKSIPIPTRTGYSFTGWSRTNTYGSLSSTTSAATYTFGTTDNVTDTITANWQKNNYNLEVRPNGGTWNGKTNNQPFTIEYQGTKTIALPTRNGYTFTSWSLNGTGSTMSSLTANNATFTMGANNATLTANWKKNNYNLEVRPNGGSWNGSTNNQTFTIECEGTKKMVLPTKDGYTFTGWTLTGAGSSISSPIANNATFTMGYENATLTANWQINKYNLEVNPNHGTWNGTTEKQNFTIDYGGTQIIPVPSRNSYNFTKWVLTGEGSKMSSLTANNANFTMGHANATLTAQWQLITHSITGNITWNDQNNRYTSRPASVQVILNSDEPVTEISQGALSTPATKNVTETQYQFDSVQSKKTKDNTNYKYTIGQNKVLGYETIINGYNITNNLILPSYTSQITMKPYHTFEDKLLKNGQVEIVGIVTADNQNRDKVGACNEEVNLEIDNAIEIDTNSIKISYIDKEGNTKNITNYRLTNHLLSVNFESNKESHITAGDSLKIELKGTLKEEKQYTSILSYTGYLRDYETGNDTGINLGTLVTSTNDITESIAGKQMPEAKIQFQKVDSITNEKLTDATFILYEWNGNEYIEKETIQDVDQNGIYESAYYRWNDTTQGNYKIIETGVPENHKDSKFSMEYSINQLKKENYTIEVDYDNEEYDIQYTEGIPDGFEKVKGIIGNEPYKVKAQITKVDKETGQIIQSEGIFSIYEWNKDTKQYEEYKNKKTNEKVTMDKQDNRYLSSEWLYYTTKNEGKYRIIENKAPQGYYADYVQEAEKKTYDIDIIRSISSETFGNQKITNEATILLESVVGEETIQNTRVKAELQVQLLDKESQKNIGQADSKLEGAIYGLYAKEDIYHADGVTSRYSEETEPGLLYRKDELIISEITNEEARMDFKDLECGRYYLKMISAPEGYVEDETEYEINLSYQGESVQQVVLEKIIKLQVKKQAFQIQKQKENKEALNNAGFSIYQINELSIVKEGKIEKIAENKYQLKDKNAKQDKRLNQKQTEDGMYYLEDLIDYYYQRYIAEEGNATVLPGDNEVYYPYEMENEPYVLDYKNNQQGEEITEIRTNQKGFLRSTELAYGEYIVIETSVPRKQEVAKPFIVKVESNAPEVQETRTIIDNDYKTKIKIYKKDQETKQTVLKDKTNYIIKDAQTNEIVSKEVWDETLKEKIEYGTLEHPFETTASGYLITPFAIKTGEYILEEVKAPEGYSVNGYEGSSKDGEIQWQREEKVKFSINSNIPYYMDENSEKIIVLNQENKAVVGTIKIITTGEYLSKAEEKNQYEFQYERRPIEGITYNIYANDDIYTQDNQGTLLYTKNQLIGEVITNKQGKATIENLPLGTYLLEKTKQLEGFSRKEPIKEVEINYEGQEVPVVFEEVFEEEIRQKVEITIHNKDSQTKEKRVGGEYALYTREEIEYIDAEGTSQIIPKDKKIITLTANEEGKIEIKRDINIDLPKGKYYFKELKAPKGYILQEEILEIDATKEEEAEIIRIEEDFFGGTITIANIKEINENDEITKGSQFEIRRKDTEEVEQHFTTNGKEEQIEMLETNVSYEIVETSPIPGYTTAEKVSFHLTENGTVIVEEGAEQEENTIIIRDYPTKVQIKIIDEETKNKIDHLEITIIDKETNQVVAATKGKKDDTIEIVETEEGYYLEKIPIGEYIIKEKTPEGYQEVEEVDMMVKDTKKLQIVNIENKRLIYDMQVEKELKSITINGKKKTVPKGEIQKVEIQESKISTIDIRLEYTIRVSNVGQTKATIGKIIDNIPDGFALISTNWKRKNKQAIWDAQKEELAPGESKEVEIILKWINNESNFGEKKNVAEVNDSTNPYHYEDKNTANNYGEVTTIFSIKTGAEEKINQIKIIEIILIGGIFSITFIGIISLIRKNKYNKK